MCLNMPACHFDDGDCYLCIEKERGGKKRGGGG